MCLISVNAPHFNAGVVLDPDTGVVVKAAPILAWAVGKSRAYLETYFKQKGWTSVEVKGKKPPMRLLVCGGREYANRTNVYVTLDHLHRKRGITCIIAGAARGADSLAADWARSRGITLEEYPADWARFGKQAGPLRNTRMLDEGRPDGVLAFPGGTGTLNMVNQAFDRKIPVSKVK